MASAAVLPLKERPNIKPTRSMTHPLRDPKGHGRKCRVKKGEPFDPEELSRRLTAHLAEQKLKAERRRDARAAKAAAAAQNHVYHHVPKVAAAAFERTATPDVLRHVHKLSQPALKQHLENLSLDEPSGQIPNLRKTQQMDQAMVEKELLRNRNQFQWTQEMEEAAERDLERDLYKPPQRTFNSDYSHLRSPNDLGAQRPLSTGDVFLEEDVPIATSKAKPRPKPKQGFDGFDGRNDWAQLDHDTDDRRATIDGKASPLRKKDSIWVLKSKKEKHSKQEKDDAVAGTGEFVPPPDGSKRKSGFLARFKRNPS